MITQPKRIRTWAPDFRRRPGQTTENDGHRTEQREGADLLEQRRKRFFSTRTNVGAEVSASV